MKVTCSHSITEKIVVVVGILISLYTLLVLVDFMRLHTILYKGTEKPLITICTKEYESKYMRGTKHIGLGYSVEYYELLRPEKNEDTYSSLEIGDKCGMFNLFYILTVWFVVM